MLYNFATQLLKDIDIKETLSKKSNKKEILDKILKVEEPIIQKEPETETEIYVDETICETISISDKELHNESSDSESDEDEEELEPDDEIYTNDGQQFYIKDMNVYKPDEDSGCTEVGILTEISEKHHTVKYNDKLYSIFHKDVHNRKGDVYICIVTNKVFNKKMKFIGKADKISNNKYNLSFLDEI
jgi:hypothetical protein